MKLHDLRPAEGSRTERTRVGRGIAAGKGKTAGRGTKGQKARAGGGIPAWFEGGQTPLHQRIPKLRGFKNRFKIEYEIVNVGDIEAAGRTPSALRIEIAKRLAQSIGPIPTFYLTTEVDMERVFEARQALVGADEGPKVSFNDIIIKSVASALRQHPECNAWWQDDHIRYWNEVHIGMAVAIEDGLITPVIRHADQKSLRQIAAEAKDLAGRARDRRLKPEEYTGATFSVSNLGMLDISEFTAIINPPEAGILAIGRLAEQPVVHDGAVGIRRRMRITMSCDHRVIDGATGAVFLKTLKAMLENPMAMVW